MQQICNIDWLNWRLKIRINADIATRRINVAWKLQRFKTHATSSESSALFWASFRLAKKWFTFDRRTNCSANERFAKSFYYSNSEVPPPVCSGAVRRCFADALTGELRALSPLGINLEPGGRTSKLLYYGLYNVWTQKWLNGKWRMPKCTITKILNLYNLRQWW